MLVVHANMPIVASWYEASTTVIYDRCLLCWVSNSCQAALCPTQSVALSLRRSPRNANIAIENCGVAKTALLGTEARRTCSREVNEKFANTRTVTARAGWLRDCQPECNLVLKRAAAGPDVLTATLTGSKNERREKNRYKKSHERFFEKD